MTKRFRTLAVLAVLAGGALALIGSTQTWLDVTLHESAHEPIAVAGADAVAVLAPLALASLALGLALSIVGRVLRYAFGVLGAAIGVALIIAAWRVAAEAPVDAFMSAVAAATGLTGAEAVSSLVAGVAVSPWPALTVLAAALVLLGAILTLATAHTWSGAGRRYRTDPAAVAASDSSRPYDAIDSWDDLSRGDDPTDR